MNESFTKIEPIKRSNSMFLHPSPDIDLKVIKQIGDYSLGIELGSGAFGKVVLGKHILTNELVAIKILDKTILSHTPDDYQSVKQEINILKSVRHKHIVQLYDVLQTSRHIFIIMEYCEGKDLLDYILTKSKLSEEESLKYFQQLINALFYLHSQNIAHRDIKIDNMLLDRNRDLKLVDFGLSTKYPDDNLLDQPCGTVVYAAPEVLQGREYHGMLADVWSSGIVLYGMLSGYLPFGEQDDDINRDNIINGRIKIPSFFSDCVKDLLMHMLDLDPMTRYTLQEVRSHPWFNLIDYKLIPGIIIGYNIIPVDEKILNLCVTYNCDKEKVRESVVNNKYNSDSALYYLLVKKLQKKGFHSVSDFCSDEFINFVLDDNNLVENKSNTSADRNNILKKNQESEIKYNININANNNCSAPPDGKLRFKQNNENNKKIGNENMNTPKNSDDENINKKINFDESPKGVLSFIINTPSFEETNKELFNMKNSNSDGTSNNNNKNNTNNDSKKTNKNTSSDSKQKYTFLQAVNVNDFQIIDEKKKEKSIDKIICQSEPNTIKENRISPKQSIETEDNNKLINVFYYHTDNNENENIENNNNFSIEKINKKNESENENENTIKKKIIETNININDTNNLNISNNNNINNDNSIEISCDKDKNKDKLNEKQLNNILETPTINNKKLVMNEDNNNTGNNDIITKEFIIETPPNNKNMNKDNTTNNKNTIEYKEFSKNKNTLSKQKVYIDKNKTFSDKKKIEDKNLDINKIKDIRKINLFQDEIKEENKDNERIILSSISEGELNEKENKSEKENNNIPIQFNNINNNNKKEMLEQISLLNDDSNIDNNNNKSNKNELLNENQEGENVIKAISNINNSTKIASNEIIIKEEKQKDINNNNININDEIPKQSNLNNKNDNIKEKNDKGIMKEEKTNINKNTQIENNKKKNKNNKKKDNNINKIKNDIKNKKNKIIESIIKNYKAILDNNKSMEVKKNKNSKSKEKNNYNINVNNDYSYSSKRKVHKNKKKEKEIISIKVIINKNLVSKEKNKSKNSKSKYRTEKQGRKIKSIYKVNIFPNNLSKNKFSTINKKQTTSIFKKKLINNQTNNKNIYNPGSHIKSSSIHILGTVARNDKQTKKDINNTVNHSNSLYKILKTKNKNTTNSKYSKYSYKNKIGKAIKNNFLINSFNNKYFKLFKSTQYKKNNLFFSNKIDKTNLNKKFEEIAHKINKSTKKSKSKSKNKKEENKLPLWKYIQSNQYLNHQKLSSSPSIGKREGKRNIHNNNNIGIDKKTGKQNSYENDIIKSNNRYGNNNTIKIKDMANISINMNKLNKNKSSTLSKDKNKNINVFFINIKNYINDKNENSKKISKNYAESSVATDHRYKSPYEIRELSESLKNKYMNKKTRYTKIPWKIKKKAIDEKKSLDDLYKLYLNKNKNPFKKNNKKIYNIKPINKNNDIYNKNIRNQILFNVNNLKGISYNNNKFQNNIKVNGKNGICKNLKNFERFITSNKKTELLKSTNKKYNQSYTPQYIHKKSFFNSFNHLNQKNIFPNKLFHSTNNHINGNENGNGNKGVENNNNMFYKNYSFIFDLSCLFVKSENINDCYQNLIDKLIKKNIYFVQKPNKVIRCFKNGTCCEIEIVKLEQINNGNNEENKNKNIYCFKALGKKGNNVNKMFKNLILG
jgi:5'-AMP-activated protein kinase catalytic alpha subunit